MAQTVSQMAGSEFADYTRTSVPQGRWSATWTALKTNFLKVVIINALMLLFLVPGICIVYLRNAYIDVLSVTSPFSPNVGLGFFPVPDTTGMAEGVVLGADLLFYSLLIVAGFIASVGLAGACYSMRKLLNSGTFTVKGFFRGVKLGYFNVVFPVTIFMVFMFASLIISDWAALAIVQGTAPAGPIVAKVFMIIATVVVGVFCAWLIAVGTTYKVKVKYLIKNSFTLMIGSIVQTVFMAGFALIPVWLVLIGGFFMVIGYILLVSFGLAAAVMVWTAFSQWVFDLYIVPVIKKEEEVARAKKTPKELAAEKEEEEKRVARQLLAAGKSELIGRPILPIAETKSTSAVGKVFDRNSLKKIKEERADMQKQIADYEDAHKGDTRYVEYNRLFAEREKALQTTDKKGKKKKVSSNNLLG